MPSDGCTSEISIVALIKAFGGSGNQFTTQQADEWAQVVGRTKGNLITTHDQLEAYYNKKHHNLERDIQLKTAATAIPTDRKRIKFREIINNGPVSRFLRKESIISEIFFRPKPSEYDTSYNNLVFIPMKHAKYRIPALWLPRDRSKGVIIFTHGNACDISNSPIVNSYRSIFDMSILAPEWPGYGLAAGQPTEEALPNTILDVIIFLNEEMKYPMSSIVLYSRSIATAPSIMVCAELESQGIRLGGLILKSPYTSWKDIVKFHARRFAVLASIVACWMAERFNVENVIGKVTIPILILHGKRDDVIPYAHSSRLFGLAGSDPNSKSIHLFEHACHDFGLDAWTETRNFLKSLNLSSQPYVTKLPPSCYDLEKDAKFAVADRARIRRNIRYRRVAIILIGIAVLVYAAVLSVLYGELDCSVLVLTWLYLHGVTIVAAAIVFLVSDWLQDHLPLASDPTVQKRFFIALVSVLLSWIADVCIGHVAIFSDTSSCGTHHHWIGLMCCMGINYIYLIQSMITNR
eukprot:TRINITY_DN2595_c5_g1_i1.p1 TRINITY_DN2595_c5_g1~~TRINITY_DN2595_c5_g1_i1.p1  ORF type:complete len:558 (+),score=72.68 TRINITY_DN2595_c5_g1_i1:116-1675(+)